MIREQVKELLPIIKAYAEGKTIQYYYGDADWIDINGAVDFSDNPSKYRIKPESKYRPFANNEECWKEMQKHQPFGWIKSNVDKHLYSILAITNNGCVLIDRSIISFQHFYKYNTFADGTPFGFKE